jgi:tRNA G18 (ribose-2'-O)-methylase SpoU
MQHAYRFFSRGLHCQRNLQAKFYQNQQIRTEKQVGKSPDLLSLDTRKEREYSGHDTLHGIHPVKCAIAARRRTIHQVSYRRDLADSPRIREVLEMCWKENITTKPVIRKMMAGDEGPHQNIFAQVSRLHYIHIPPENESLEMLDDTQGLSKKVWLFLYGIQDPMNFGSLLRTAYMLGVDKIFVTNRER